MTNGKRNRQAGHKLERDLANLFREAGFVHVVTARSESKSRDNKKVDLMNEDEGINGRLEYNVQAKTSTTHLSYAKILSELPQIEGIENVVIHRQTKKVNRRFMVRGEYAILELSAFMRLIEKLKRLQT